MLHQNGQKLMQIEQQSKTAIDLNVINSKVDVDFFSFLEFWILIIFKHV